MICRCCSLKTAPALVLFRLRGFIDTEVDRNGANREQCADEHTELHAELLWCERHVRCHRGEGRGCDRRVSDDTDQLRSDGCTEVTAGSYHRKDEDVSTK